MAAYRNNPASLDQTGPFLKWAGGKGQLLKQFAPFFPSTLEGRHYVEPFLGSGAVFFYVRQNLNPSSCTLLDVNPELINAFRQIRDNVEELIRLLTEHRRNHNRDGITEEERKTYYYSVRAESPEALSPEGAARFISRSNRAVSQVGGRQRSTP
jgi:DNA adenine methylase